MARGRAADGADAHCNRSQTEAATAPSDDGRASEDVRHDRPEGRSLTQTEGANHNDLTYSLSGVSSLDAALIRVGVRRTP